MMITVIKVREGEIKKKKENTVANSKPSCV